MNKKIKISLKIIHRITPIIISSLVGFGYFILLFVNYDIHIFLKIFLGCLMTSLSNTYINLRLK